MTAYLPLLVLILVAVGLGVMLAKLSKILGPARSGKSEEAKLMPYESGMDSIGTARERFSVKFYLVAMLFILFDIEVVFMYPWAVQYKQLILDTNSLFPFYEMLTFVGILFVGFIYIYKKGGFKWS